MKDLLWFKKECEKQGICESMKALWDNARSDEDLICVASSVRGMDYISDAHAKGWFVDLDWMRERFNSYINGYYMFDNGLYTSSIYVSYTGNIKLKSRAIMLLDCNCTIESDNMPHMIYVSGKSRVEIKNGHNCICYIYGESPIIIGDCETVTKLNRD